MKNSSVSPNTDFPKKPEDLLKTIAANITNLGKNAVVGPSDLIVHDQKWQGLINLSYDSHNTEKVKLNFTKSFTFGVLAPESFVVF